MRVVSNLPEHPGRIYPIRSFGAAAAGERRDGSTGSCLPCQYRPKCFHIDCSPQFPHISLEPCLLQLAPLLSFFLPLLCAQGSPFPSLLPNLRQPEDHLPAGEVISWGALLPHPPLQTLGLVCISSGGELIFLP